MLTDQQQQTLVAALGVETDPAVVSALAIRNDVALAAWLNSASSTAAWRTRVGRTDLFDAMSITQFDNLTAGKRDAWRLMMDMDGVDFTRNKVRNAVTDIWAAAQADAILQAATEFATRAENILGGNSATTGTVTAIKRNYVGTLSVDDVSRALNKWG